MHCMKNHEQRWNSMINTYCLQIVVEAVRGDSYTGDIAIDDISFDMGCKRFVGQLPYAPTPPPTNVPPTTLPHHCTTAEFNCVNQGAHSCIPNTQVLLLLFQ